MKFENIIINLKNDLRGSEIRKSYGFSVKYNFDNGLVMTVARKSRNGKKPRSERGEFTSLGASKGLYEVALYKRDEEDPLGIDFAWDLQWSEATLEALTSKQEALLRDCIVGYLKPAEVVEMAAFIADLEPQD